MPNEKNVSYAPSEVLSKDAFARLEGSHGIIGHLISHKLDHSETTQRSGLVAERRKYHHEAALHAQLTRERLGKMEAVLKEAEPTFERIPLYIEKLRLIKRSMNQIDAAVKTMRVEAADIYQSSGLEK